MITLSILIVLALICALVGVLMGLFSLIGLLASLLVGVLVGALAGHIANRFMGTQHRDDEGADAAGGMDATIVDRFSLVVCLCSPLRESFFIFSPLTVISRSDIMHP